MRFFAVIVAGGSGTRMNSEIPKQFLELGGRPVIMHSLIKLYTCGLHPEIILVLPDSQIEYWAQLCIDYKFDIPVKIVKGGQTRYHSVKNALELITEPGLVAIHDAVRPLVSTGTILAAYAEAEIYGSAVPAVPLKDSIRKIDSAVSVAVDRSLYRIVQTPQCFQTELLKKAYEKEYKSTFTDDASVVESNGGVIRLIEGTSENIKITNPQDLLIAEALLKEN